MKNTPDKLNSLFERVVNILEVARSNVVRSVNSNMVLAYWLIGREIVQEVQGGEKRAEYGKQVIENLSTQLMAHYGSGFSVTTLQYFRKFYVTYPNRGLSISRLPGVELDNNRKDCQKSRPLGVESTQEQLRLENGETDLPRKTSPAGRELFVEDFPSSETVPLPEKSHPADSRLSQGFSPLLSWSHYRALMRVKNEKARLFYEREAVECGWSKKQLERQIHSSYYERIIANRGEAGLTATDRERLPGKPLSPETMIKSPYVLEFLGLPDSPGLHENTMEQAIIDNLQSFLLELGKGFSFVARQKHICFDEENFYIDLVFYNFVLKCFLLIDLKIGKLNHQDVGQMDGYVRLFEDQFKVPGDNPTIGLILCSDKSEAVAKYSVLSEGKKVFASKYLKFLPTEEQLKLEIEKERRLIEQKLEDRC